MKLTLNPAAAVRTVVSAKKRRYQEHGFDLDLSYITERIIAMGVPSEGAEALYRNPMPAVKALLNKFHAGHYKVFNLCSEYVYDSKHFEGSLARYPFDDHQTTTLSMILSFCRDAEDWLQKDEKNVMVVHCKAGKGRTGLMVCCLMMYLGLTSTPEEAVKLFAARRTLDGKGITIPSQKRYVEYAHQLFTIHNHVVPQSERLVLERVTVGGLPFQGDKDEFFIVIWIKCSEDAPSIAIFQATELKTRTKTPSIKIPTAAANMQNSPLLSPNKSGQWESLHRNGACVQLSTASESIPRMSSTLPARTLRPVLSAKAKLRAWYLDRKECAANDISGTLQKMRKRRSYSAIPTSSKSGAVVVPCDLAVVRTDLNPSLTWENFSPHVLLMGNVKVEIFQRRDGKDGGRSLGYTWFNTAFMPGVRHVKLGPKELDKVKLPALSLDLKFVNVEDCWTNPLPARDVCRARSFSVAEMNSSAPHAAGYIVDSNGTAGIQMLGKSPGNVSAATTEATGSSIRQRASDLDSVRSGAYSALETLTTTQKSTDGVASSEKGLSSKWWPFIIAPKSAPSAKVAVADGCDERTLSAANAVSRNLSSVWYRGHS